MPIPKGACDTHVHVFDARYPFAARRTYTPGAATTQQLRAHLARCRLDRVVLVQPSVYGTANECLLAALDELGPATARGVAVIDPAATADAALADMDRRGVRAVRLNVATAGGDAALARRDLAAAAALVAPLGWAVQVFAPLAMVLGLRDVIERCACPVILDHFAGLRLARVPSATALDELAALAGLPHVHVKLSAAGRVCEGAADGEQTLATLAAALVAARPDGPLWGSDWPHTGLSSHRQALAPGDIQPFEVVDDPAALQRLRGWCGSDAAFGRILSGNAARLFQFPDTPGSA